MKLKIVSLTAALLLALVSRFECANPQTTENFPNTQVLQSPDLSILYWKSDTQYITFELHVKNTSKWFMFGISGFPFSDVVVSWINPDGTGHFTDRMLTTDPASNKTTTSIDQKQDWRLLDAFISNEYTVVKFIRPILIYQCDSSVLEDIDITVGNINLMFAGGNSPNLDDNSIPIANSTLTTVQANLLNGNAGPFNCIAKSPKLQFNSTPTDTYSNQADLIDGVYRLYWNYTGTDIIAEIHCRTLGWVGFGLSPTGGMNGSDVVIGWINNGVTNFTDRHIVGKSVLIDNNQNWTLVQSLQRADFTIFKFQRSVVACDSDDMTITVAAPSVIFAYGTSAPVPGGDISYHGATNRGSRKINLIGVAKNKNMIVPDSETVDFTINGAVLPKQDTFYYCRGFKVPSTLSQKRHIYKWELLFSEYNFMNMHHILIYECDGSYTGSSPNYEMNCDMNEAFYTYCNIISNGWAVGGDLVGYFPDTTGYPIGGDTDYKYFFVQVHYNNPDMNIGYIEKLTLRYYVTKTLRQNELGILTLGTDPSPWGIALPPQVSNIPLQVYCDNSCISGKLENTSLTVVSTIPHTHTTGVSIYTKIIRNGNDIGYVLDNENYDFNYQASYILDPPVVITKNDALITRCTYNTMGRKDFVVGGHTTQQEMCFHFLTVYPRLNNFRSCYSFPSIKTYIDLLNNLSKSNETNMTPIVNYTAADLFTGFYQTFPYFSGKTISDSVRNKFLNFINTTMYMATCGNDFKADPMNQIRPLNNYIAPDICQTMASSWPSITNIVAIFNNIWQTGVNIFNWFYNIFRYF